MLLLYGMTADNPHLQQHPGVRGAKIECIAGSGVYCIYSEFEPQSSTPESLTQDALALHNVLQHILSEQTVLPFRFPTMLAEEAAVRSFAAKHGVSYAGELKRLRSQVQAEVRITRAAEVATPAATGSGTEYMKRKQDALQQMDSVVAEVISQNVSEHRRRTLPTPGAEQLVKLTCLLAKDEFQDFKQRVNGIALSPGFTLRLTGPWPPADFANCYPEAE